MFQGINIFWAWLRVILTWAFRPGLKWLWVGTKTYLGSKTWTVVQTIITTLEGTEKIKTEKMTTWLKQPQEYLQVLQVLFSLNENTPSSETGKKFQNLAMWVFFQKLLKAWKGNPSLSTVYLFISCLHWAIVWNNLTHKRHHHAQHNDNNNIESQTLWNWMLTLFYPFIYKCFDSKSGHVNMTSHLLNTKSLYYLS